MKLLTMAVLASAMAMAMQAQNPPPPPQQTFRTGIDVVNVDASVRRGNTPVTGLTPADFELTDNGVRQEIESVVTTDVPIDLTIVVDVSGNPDRPWTNLPPAAKVAADIEQRARRLTGLLREGDRVRLLAIDTYVQQVWPLQAAKELPAITRVTYDGLSGLYSTLATALLQPVDLNRRHVIVGITRGHDNSGLLTAPAVRALAEQSDAQLHLVMDELAADAEVSVKDFQCDAKTMALCRPTARFHLPSRRRLFTAISVSCCFNCDCPRILLPDGIDLKAGAEASGGGWYQGELVSTPSLHGTFAKAFQDFRQSYVLRYTPRGVTAEGWHRIAVRVPKQPGLKIRARTGYAVEAPREAPAAPPPLPATFRSLEDFVTAYERGAYAEVASQLQRHSNPGSLVQLFDRRPSPWPANPLREAAFALELAEAGLFSARADVREEAVKLLQRFEILLRPTLDLEPDFFERAWLTAELAILQATLKPAISAPFVERALARFPQEARFVLARAIISDQRTAVAGATTARPTVGGNRPLPAPSIDTNEIIGLYEAAASHVVTRAEALTRLGWLLHRLERDEEALVRLKDAASAEAPDTHVRYVRELLTGQVLLSLNRAPEAVDVLRRATSIAPGAQSARVALMTALVMTGDRAGSESLAESIQTAAPVLDPWTMYWQGLYREYPDATRRLRSLSR